MPDSPIVYLNGKFLPLDQACVPVLDRGFIFGDGVYEVIPAYGGKLFRLAEHLLRLDHSLDGVRTANPLTHAAWEKTLVDLIGKNAGGGNTDQYIYLQVTRGVAKRDHAFPKGVTPTVFAMSNPLPPIPESYAAQGIAAVTLDDIRWKYCHIKAITLLPNILLRQEAVDKGATEAILVRDGEVTEGAASNVFIVKNNTVITPPKSPRLLPGITRDLILELAAQHGIAWREAAISERALREADEVWLTSSTKEIMPVTRLDDARVGNGKPGPMWQRMTTLFQDYKRTLRGGSHA
ncbi:MAG: D-amino acid aminotransferase [Gammaproteobacteria bacterium]|nr:MAG: D-amino acid aminotransferase [Gammaproteobacteria bacterium]